MTPKRKEEIRKADAQKKLLKLDFGCGQSKQAGYLGVDIIKVDGVDIVQDLFKFPWPWKDASVEEIFCSHFFEHIPGLVRDRFMDECYRILIPGGKMRVVSPYYSSMRAVQDYTHQWPPISEASFYYFNREWRKTNKLDHYPIRCDFDFQWAYAFAPDVAMRATEHRDFALRSFNNQVLDIHVELTKR